MRRPLRFAGLALLLLGAGAYPAAAAPVTLAALDSGQYDAVGSHLLTNENYLTGIFNTERRSFFLFDLSSVSGTINSATLRLFNPEVSAFLHGYVSPDPTETLNIYDVGTDATAVTLGTGGAAAFADFGSGTLYGTRTVSAADNGTVVEITLNAAALADLNAASGLFLFGGALGSLAGPSDQHVFGFSMTNFVPDHTRELVLDVSSVPEPSMALLLITGAAAYGSRRRKARAHGTR